MVFYVSRGGFHLERRMVCLEKRSTTSRGVGGKIRLSRKKSNWTNIYHVFTSLEVVNQTIPKCHTNVSRGAKPYHPYVSRGTKPYHRYVSRGSKPYHPYISRGTKSYHPYVSRGNKPYQSDTHLKKQSIDKCNQCDFVYSQTCDLKKHLKRHSGEKPRFFSKKGLGAMRTTLCAPTCWPSSQARVTSVNSLSSFRSLRSVFFIFGAGFLGEEIFAGTFFLDDAVFFCCVAIFRMCLLLSCSTPTGADPIDTWSIWRQKYFL